MSSVLPRTIYVKVSTELLSQMFYEGWSEPVQVRPVQEPDDTWTLEVRRIEEQPGAAAANSARPLESNP